MGKFNSGSNKIYQELSGALPGGIWSTPAFFGTKLYFGPVGQPILAFQFKNAKLLDHSSGENQQYLRLSRSHSQHLLQQRSRCHRLGSRKYQSRGLARLQRNQPAGAVQHQPGRRSRDHFGAGNKFITPLIINGKVYVGTTTGVGVFGLLPK